MGGSVLTIQNSKSLGKCYRTHCDLHIRATPINLKYRAHGKLPRYTSSLWARGSLVEALLRFLMLVIVHFITLAFTDLFVCFSLLFKPSPPPPPRRKKNRNTLNLVSTHSRHILNDINTIQRNTQKQVVTVTSKYISGQYQKCLFNSNFNSKPSI